MKAARETAQKVRALLKDGTDPKAFLTGKGANKDDGKAKEAAEHRTAIKAGRWTWEVLAGITSTTFPIRARRRVESSKHRPYRRQQRRGDT